MSTDYSHFSNLAFDRLFARGPAGQEIQIINSSGTFVGPISDTGTISVTHIDVNSNASVVGKITANGVVIGQAANGISHVLTLSSTAALAVVAPSGMTVSGALTVSGVFTPVGFVSHDFVPSPNATYSLGTSGNKWKDLFLSRNLSVGSAATFTGKITANGVVIGQSANGLSHVNSISSTGALAVAAPSGMTVSGALTVSGTFTPSGFVSGNFIPTPNATYTLGNTGNRWKDLFLTGDITSSGALTLTGNAQAAKGTFNSVIIGSAANTVAHVNTLKSTGTLIVRTSGTTAFSGTITVTSAILGSQIANASSSAAGVVSTGSQSFAGSKTFTTALAGSNVVSASTSASGVVTTGSQSFAGTKTFATPLAGTNIASASTSASGVVTTGTQSLAGAKTFATQLIGKGTATNNDAATGYIGEYITAAQTTSTNFGASTSLANLVSITLTAGDWDIDTILQFDKNASTTTRCQSLLSSQSAPSSDAVTGTTATITDAAVALESTSITIPAVRASISGTTTYYLQYKATYGAGTPQARGRISARRVR